MTPKRRIRIDEFTITEYYWAGKMVTYIDSKAFKGTYEEAIRHVKAKIDSNRPK